MIYSKIKKNPFLLFLPFLVLYIVLILIFPTDGKFGDESRYVIYAKYMLHGNLPVGEEDFDNLGNGPGYSMILLPFVALKLPLPSLALLNAVFFYLSLVFLYKTLINFVSSRKTLLCCLFWGMYLNMYEYLIKILPETFTSFLITIILFFVVKLFVAPKPKKYFYFTGLLIGYLTLTKPIFGYVLLCLLSGSLVLLAFFRTTIYKKLTTTLLIAFAAITPYLIYTYTTTNKLFYWSSFGGTSLYWMTTTYEKEYGSWFPDVVPKDKAGFVDTVSQRNLIINYEESLRVNHAIIFEEINKYKVVEKDDAFKKAAMANIKSHPFKFFQNCISNLGRILFNLPYSYKLQSPRTLLRLPFTGILLILMLACIYPTICNWRKINFSLRLMLFFTFIYLGGSIFGSSETRMFTVVVPIFLFWVSYIFERNYKVTLKFE